MPRRLSDAVKKSLATSRNRKALLFTVALVGLIASVGAIVFAVLPTADDALTQLTTASATDQSTTIAYTSTTRRTATTYTSTSAPPSPPTTTTNTATTTANYVTTTSASENTPSPSTRSSSTTVPSTTTATTAPSTSAYQSTSTSASTSTVPNTSPAHSPTKSPTTAAIPSTFTTLATTSTSKRTSVSSRTTTSPNTSTIPNPSTSAATSTSSHGTSAESSTSSRTATTPRTTTNKCATTATESTATTTVDEAALQSHLWSKFLKPDLNGEFTVLDGSACKTYSSHGTNDTACGCPPTLELRHALGEPSGIQVETFTLIFPTCVIVQSVAGAFNEDSKFGSFMYNLTVLETHYTLLPYQLNASYAHLKYISDNCSDKPIVPIKQCRSLPDKVFIFQKK